tara:strand:- start:133 stop:453 length:321 start_codon:yes stop_codon:yes gene_type:complete
MIKVTLSKKKIKRDQFVESACETARLNLHRFKASASYAVDEIKNELFSSPEVLVEVTVRTKDNSKTCPKCSSKLTVKTAQKGKNKGNNFLACSSFPKCRYVQEVKV